MNKGSEKQKVFVGLSGGVDSSVSAYLLKERGFDVTGVFIKVWQPDFVPCTWREDRQDAMRVAAKLQIPFVTLDLEKEYKEGVIDYMINEYKAGRTPNPDVFCNKEVKFGAFLKWALSNGANYVATGHYAINENNNLLRSPDQGKDQSYFLWALTEDQLKHTIFPVGNLHKEEVRKIAERAGLITASKKDSQGLCFISNVDMKQFLKHFIKVEKGDVLNKEGGVVGSHEGVFFYTIGERHGFEIFKKTTEEKPYYVVSKDIEKNTLTVSNDERREELGKNKYEIRTINWISGSPKGDEKILAQIRYHGEEIPCIVTGDKNIAEVNFEKPILISSGQSIVFYKDNICLGGGIIS